MNYYLLQRATPNDAPTQKIAGWRIVTVYQNAKKAVANRANWTHERVVEAEDRADLRRKLEADQPA